MIPLDPANDPPTGDRLDPYEDFGRAPGGLWHALVSGYGTRVDALCGVRIHVHFETRRGRPDRDQMCADCLVVRA